MPLRRLTEDDVPHLAGPSLEHITWSPVSGFKGLENDVVIVAGVTDIEADWHRGIASVFNNRGIESTFLKGWYLDQELTDKGFTKPVYLRPLEEVEANTSHTRSSATAPQVAHNREKETAPGRPSRLLSPSRDLR